MNKREIKFRIWNEKGKVMQEPQSFKDFTDGGYFGANFDHLMQFTGKYDKDGKEIYEGDIVRTLYEQPDGSGVIRAKPRAVKWTHAMQLTGFNLGKGRKSSKTHTQYEILGNIYEDPKLLDRLLNL